MSSVVALLKTNKLNQLGECPIYIRIIKDRKARFVSTGFYIDPKYWDAEKCRVRPSYENSARANKFIAAKLLEAEDVALDMETKSKYVTGKKIKEKIMGATNESFLKFFERHLQELEHNKQMGSLDKAQAVFSKLKKYVGDHDLLFNDIDVPWLKSYESYLRVDLNNSTNTIHSNLKIFRRLFNAAVAEELAPLEKNPFLRYKLKWQQVKKEFLTEDELKKVEELPLEKNSRKDHHRNMYVFAAYTGGMRISDILQLRWKNFDGEKIFVHTQKTKSAISIKLPPKSLEILNNYKSKESKPSHFIFPILSDDLDMSDARKVFNAISSATASTNTDLKDIAKAAGIEKHLHFHTSRHTWATRALTKGMRIEHVSKLMGHNSIKTTQIYAKIVNEELDKAMEEAFG
ncbi:MAG: site-specific integrase [Bacteroidetes bacterium]|nr:site-specific integrase [Bacteroidota bacterium]